LTKGADRRYRSCLNECGFSMANISYQLLNGGKNLEYHMTVRTTNPSNMEKLAQLLLKRDEVIEFNISRAGD